MQREADESSAPVLSPEEVAFRASMAKLVDWYRVRQSRALLCAFLPAGLFLPLGNLLIALSLGHGSALPLAYRPVLSLVGLCVTALGPLWATWQLFHALRSGDAYVAIRVDGLSLKLDPARDEELYRWEQVQGVTLTRDPALVRIELDNGAPVLVRGPFAEVSLDELARRIRDARRLAVWNRLVPRFPMESP